MIRVGVVGALGKMGKEVVKAIINAQDTELVMAVDIMGEGTDAGIAACNRQTEIMIETDILKAIEIKKPDIIIDFTQPNGIFEHVTTYIKNKVKSVIGTTGLKEDQIAELKKLSKELERYL